jgi:hypothetical protein
MSARYFTLSAQALLILFWCIGWHVLQDCRATERATRFSASNQRVGLNLPYAKFDDVLNVLLVVVVVVGIV